MNRPRNLLSRLCESDSIGLWRALVLGMVLACLTAHSIGVNLLIGAFVRVSPEETSEESHSEVDLRAVSHKCARVRFLGPRREGFFSAGLSRGRSDLSAPPQPQAALGAPRLRGAGIRVRC